MRLAIPALLILLVTNFTVVADDAKVQLKTEIPEEILAGTPPDVLRLLFPHLPPPEESAPKFMVPEGTTNLALKKKVTSSDPMPILGELKYVTDGNKTGDEGSFVELGPMTQWVQIDLEKPSTIYAIYIWHYFMEARAYTDVVVQISNDPEFKKGVTTVFNNDQDNTLKFGAGKDRPFIDTYLGKLVDGKGTTGRYVRLYSRGNTANDLNHYVEVEVFGKPVESVK